MQVIVVENSTDEEDEETKALNPLPIVWNHKMRCGVKIWKFTRLDMDDMDLYLDQRLAWIIKILFNIWVHSPCYETRIFRHQNIEDKIQFEIKDNSKSKVEKLGGQIGVLKFWNNAPSHI